MKWKRTIRFADDDEFRTYFDTAYVATNDVGVQLPQEHVHGVIIVRIKRKFFISNNNTPGDKDDIGPFPTLTAAKAAAGVLIQAGGFSNQAYTPGPATKQWMPDSYIYNSLTRWKKP